jgi:hypothetical protein
MFSYGMKTHGMKIELCILQYQSLLYKILMNPAIKDTNQDVI